MNPSTAEEWLVIAKERAVDAEIINEHHANSVGSVYLAGYAIECSLKAFLQKQNTPFPKHGSEGHNLRALWKASNFRLSDLKNDNGSKSFFIESWNTDLRYKTKLELNIGLTNNELIQGAKELTGWIQQQTRRQRRRK